MSYDFPKSALEEYVEGSTDLPQEEADVMIDQADQNAASAASSIEQTRRLLETASVLEELAVVATRIERATPTETRLIENVSDMAAAGTNIAPQNFIPSMEGYIGRRISMESVVDTIKKVLEIVLAHLTKIWQYISDFFKLAFVIPNMLQLIKERQRILKTLGDPMKDVKEVKFEQRFSNIKIAGRIPFILPQAGKTTSELMLRELNAGLDSWETMNSFVQEDYLNAVTGSAGCVFTALDTFDITNPTKAADTLETKLAKSLVVSIPKGRNGANVKENEIVYSHQTGPVMFGDQVLSLTAVNSTANAASTLDALAAYKKFSLLLEDTNITAPDDSADYMTMKVMTTEEIGDLLKRAYSLLSGQADFYVGSEWRGVNTVRVALERSSKKATANITSSKDLAAGTGLSPQGEEYYRSIIDYNLVFAGWVQSPAVEMYRKTITIARTLIAITDEQMRSYELKS